MPPRRRDLLAARQPADIRSPIGIRQVPEDVTGGPRSAWISAILDKALLGETQVRLWQWKLARFLRDAVPKVLQIADLLGFRQRPEPRRFCDAGARRSSLAFAWS
jgi:hypothetical protein